MGDITTTNNYTLRQLAVRIGMPIVEAEKLERIVAESSVALNNDCSKSIPVKYGACCLKYSACCI